MPGQDPVENSATTIRPRSVVTLSRRDRQVLLSRYRLVDIARKIVGVGSVGTRAWVLLLMSTQGSDPLIPQAKEASKSVLTPYSNCQGPRHQGQRVVEGQRLLQSASDIMLGWQTTREPNGTSRAYYLRQLRDGKGDFDVTAMSPTALRSYARSCGWTLARAHARAGDRAAIRSAVRNDITAEKAETVRTSHVQRAFDNAERAIGDLHHAVLSEQLRLQMMAPPWARHRACARCSPSNLQLSREPSATKCRAS